jgi:CheY-like chemotaxis protein
MLRVLLVEDEAIISLVTSITLEDAGYHVTIASDGQAGLELALQNRPELIITDFMMPRLSGLEMIAKLRAHGFTKPIVLATAIPEAHLPITDKLYDAYLSKPFTDDQLLGTLERIVRS